MAEFELFGETLTIPNSYIRAGLMHRRADLAAEKAEKEFISWYKKCLGIGGVLDGYKDIANELLLENVKCLFGELAELDIYDTDEKMYIRRCADSSHIDRAYDVVAYDLEEINDDKEEIMEYRAERKANRGRFVGGGFGVSGAIKGSMKAGALNMSTGLAHSAVNTIGNIGSSLAASAKKAALYNGDTRETLGDGIYLAITKLYENHVRLVNEHIKNYYVDGFEPEKAKALFQNAKNIPEKREELLFQAVECLPEENILSYIFVNYHNERKNVYKIGQTLGIDFSGYFEESFAKSYTDDIKENPQKVEELKAEIVSTMKEFGISSSATLTQINYDALIRIAKSYKFLPDDKVNEKVIEEFVTYDATVEQKTKVVHECYIWDLAKKYGVDYSKKEKESILKRYYSEKVKNNEEYALDVKKKLIEIMHELEIEDSATFNQVETDCLQRLCGNIADLDEAECNATKEKLTEYDALDKNKKSFFDAIQKRIEDIWSAEDGEIFDNVYLNTDIHNQDEINKSIEFIKEKGRTSNSQKYIKALESCNDKNIKKARKYEKKSAKTCNTIGIVLLIMGIGCLFFVPVFAVIAIPGIILMVRYSGQKKMWNIFTIDGTQFHSMIVGERPVENTTEQAAKVNLSKETAKNNNPIQSKDVVQNNNIVQNSDTANDVLITKNANDFAIVSLISGIAMYPLVLTEVLWLPACIIAIVFGILALKNKTERKGLAVAGLICPGVFVALIIIGLMA